MGEFSRRYGHLALCGLLSVVGCAGPSAEKSGGGSGKLPPQVLDTSDVAEMIAALPGSSPRCQGGLCQCREIDASGRGNAETDAESAPPAPGFKRFELRTGRGDDTMRITIEGVGTFVKSGANPEARCIYVDLPAGAHRVRYHITAANPTQGAEPRLRISEYGEKFKRWYRTFGFRCTDGSQPCTKDLARDEFDRLAKQTDGKFDPCGSTKVQGLRFSTDREADAAVGDFNLQLVLNTYKFTPRFAPDTPNCKGLSKPAGSAAAAADDGEMSVQPAK
ncbi:MAG: hypothetical protein JNM83_11135 [Myxococcales bacterium]|jgi:hypothetical protein|nr:hypothetical protein [Myxococcales bacterium]